MLPIQVRRNGVRTGWELPIEGFHREFERMFDQLWKGDSGELTAWGAYPVNIREDQDKFHVEAELPGYKRDEIEVTLENGVLTITAERKAQAHEGSVDHLRERRLTRVARRFTLPTMLDENSVDARLEDGVLYLTLEKRAEVKPRKIEVK